jgi:hypothetical protein
LLSFEAKPARRAVEDKEKDKAATAYDVTVDSVGMSWEPAGPLFERYTVDLTGRIDRRWVAAYTRLSATAEYSRFRLEPGASNVSFTTRSTDGPVQVMGVIKKLEALVQSVNRAANNEVVSERDTHSKEAQLEETAVRRFSNTLVAKLGLSRGAGNR